MTRDIFNGSTGNVATLLILEAGEPNTSVVWNTAGLSIAYKIDAGSEVVITLTSGNFRHIGGGKYYVDVADSVYLAANLGKLIQFYGTLSGSAIYGEQHRVVANNPSVLLPTAANVTTAVWAFDLATAGANTAGAALAAVATSFTKLFRWLGVLAGKGSDPVTLAEINATDGGATFDNATRSLEALGDANTAQEGDWAITRTFRISGGDKVSGVRMSLVGVAGKTDTTGSSGIATVKTDDGTYTLRVVVPTGYEDVADTTVTIDGADSVATVTLVATTVTPPTNPAKSALEILCLDETGEPEADVAVDIRIAVVPSGDQNVAYKGTKQTATSDANGVARLEAIKGAEYEYKRGKAEVWNRVTIGNGDTTSVSSFIGSP